MGDGTLILGEPINISQHLYFVKLKHLFCIHVLRSSQPLEKVHENASSIVIQLFIFIKIVLADAHPTCYRSFFKTL